MDVIKDDADRQMGQMGRTDQHIYGHCESYTNNHTLLFSLN